MHYGMSQLKNCWIGIGLKSEISIVVPKISRVECLLWNVGDMSQDVSRVRWVYCVKKGVGFGFGAGAASSPILFFAHGISHCSEFNGATIDGALDVTVGPVGKALLTELRYARFVGVKAGRLLIRALLNRKIYIEAAQVIIPLVSELNKPGIKEVPLPGGFGVEAWGGIMATSLEVQQQG